MRVVDSGKLAAYETSILVIIIYLPRIHALLAVTNLCARHVKQTVHPQRLLDGEICRSEVRLQIELVYNGYIGNRS